VTARYDWAQDLPGQQPTLDVGVRKDNRAVIIPPSRPPITWRDVFFFRGGSLIFQSIGYTFAGRKGRGSCWEGGTQ